MIAERVIPGTTRSSTAPSSTSAAVSNRGRTHNPELWTNSGAGAAVGALEDLRGPYQPYGVWIPERLPTPAPLIVFLHGTGSNHLRNASR